MFHSLHSVYKISEWLCRHVGGRIGKGNVPFETKERRVSSFIIIEIPIEIFRQAVVSHDIWFNKQKKKIDRNIYICLSLIDSIILLLSSVSSSQKQHDLHDFY